MSFYLIAITLFAGICFSFFYLRNIREYARNDNIQLLSHHTFIAAIFVTTLLILVEYLAMLLHVSLPWKIPGQNLNTTLTSFSFLLTYLGSFLLAFILGNFLGNIEFGYRQIAP